MKFKWDEFFVTGDPLILGAQVSIALSTIAIIFVLTYFKKWKWLWSEWITTVDHKKLGIMYIISAVIMLFRGGVDGLMMRAQLALPNNSFLDSNHYNEIFTTHGTIMIDHLHGDAVLNRSYQRCCASSNRCPRRCVPLLEQPELLDVLCRGDAFQYFFRYRRFSERRLDELYAACK